MVMGLLILEGLEAPTGRDGGQNSYGVRQDSYEVTPPDRPVHTQPPDLIDRSERRHPKGPVALRVRPGREAEHHQHELAVALFDHGPRPLGDAVALDQIASVSSLNAARTRRRDSASTPSS
jgi:hypothetical protein